MSILEWRGEFETGIDYLDFEHRRLVDLINRIADGLGKAGHRDATAERLGQLYARVSAHFALEEHLMRERKYDLYDAHKAEHEELLEEMRYMMDAFESGACDTCGTTLDECLGAWFRKHFRSKDARLETLRR